MAAEPKNCVILAVVVRCPAVFGQMIIGESPGTSKILVCT